ncbi:MAG: tripartite tricarboxylate transporter substrate binding protein [Hyphomicrobiales bacterium]|nr:tripartite tricarboxylate transporter substrate binding protein [Hyphomicrobiales bacterium]
MHQIAVFVASATLALAGVASGVAQDYPSRPIKLVLPQPPGGAIDLISRALGERLSEQMKQPVIVENMPGANGGLAAGHVVRSTPDGDTLFMAVDTNLVVNPSLYPNLAYDPFRDFAPISVLAKVSLVLVANPKVPANNVRELIGFAKANPGKLNYASIGLGTQSHLGMELFKTMTGTDINQVSYRGTAPAMTDVVAGLIDVIFTGPPSAKAMSEGGKLKILAIGGKQRLKLMPDVPTVDESGVPGYELTGWFGIVAPARTPSPVLDRLSREVRAAVADARFSGRIAAQGLEIVGGSAQEMNALMQADTRKWAEIIKATGARIAQ